MSEPTRPLVHPAAHPRARASTGLRWLVGALCAGLVASGIAIGLLVAEVRQQEDQLDSVNADLAQTARELRQRLNALNRAQRAAESTVDSLQSNLDQVSDTMRETSEELRDQLPDWNAIGVSVSPSVFRVICETDEVTSSGSGFALGTERPTEGTTIITNQHVIEPCVDGVGVITLRHGSTSYDVELTRTSADPDVATLVTPEDLPVLEVGDTPRESDPVMAIGTPLGLAGFENTKTFGRISRFEGNLIQFDASINRGNSGGPLIDGRGRVIGINTYKGEGEGLSLAIRMGDVCDVVGCAR